MSDGSQPDDDPKPVNPFEAFSGNPFEALSGADLQELFRMLQSPGPVNWEIARQVATGIATADIADDAGAGRRDRHLQPATDQKGADELVQLTRVAQLHVADTTGLAEVGAVPVRVVNRVEWTEITLDGLRPVLEALSTTLTGDRGAVDPSQWPTNPAEAAQDPELIAGLITALAPTLFGVQAGSLVGLLAQHALGQHDLPLPLAGDPQLAFVPSNVDSFADDWSIERRDLRFALALREVVRCAPRSVPWVRARLLRLSSEYVSGYELRPEAIEEQLAEFLPEGFDPMSMLADLEAGNANLEAFPEIDIDPTRLLDGLRSERQEPVRADLQRFGSVLEGYTDTLVGLLTSSLAPGTERIDEALRRHRVESGRHTDFVERMLGLELERVHYEQGQRFCAGVVDRVGVEGLNRLWERDEMLPTSSELEAPGLWLARIDLDLP